MCLSKPCWYQKYSNSYITHMKKQNSHLNIELKGKELHQLCCWQLAHSFFVCIYLDGSLIYCDWWKHLRQNLIVGVTIDQFDQMNMANDVHLVKCYVFLCGATQLFLHTVQMWQLHDVKQTLPSLESNPKHFHTLLLRCFGTMLIGSAHVCPLMSSIFIQ